MVPFYSDRLADCDQILFTKDVLRMLGCGRTTLHNYRKRGVFPQPFTLVPGGRNRWRRSQVQHFIDSQEAVSANPVIHVLQLERKVTCSTRRSAAAIVHRTMTT